MLQYSPKITTDGLVMCLDASNNKSYPTDLPVKNGLVMWMDAADDTTFSYSSGTTVSQWRDKSGFNYHMVPVSAGPTRNAFLNSRKVIAFTTSQQIWNSAINLVTSTYTIFGVTRLTGTTNARVLSTQYTGNLGGNWLLGHWAGYVNQYFAEGWVSGPYGTAANTAWNIFMGDWNRIGDLANLYTNGTAIVINSVGAEAGPMGLGININSETSTCEAAEIVVFDRVLSATERKQVHTYLGQKWGISNTDRSIVDLAGNDDNGLFGNGTVANMPAYDYYNKGTLKFDGSNDYVSVGANAILRGNSISLGVFFKTINNGQSVQFIAGYGDTGVQGYWLGVVGGPIRFFVGNGSTSLQLNSGISPNNDQIYYVVGTYDGTNQRIYVDGVLMASSTSVNGSLSYTGMTDGFLIGQVQGFTGGRYLTGNIYAMQVYNRALSAVEVAQNYEAQKSKFANTIVQQGLVLNLDAGNPYSYAGAGTTIYDVSGNSYNGTLTNSPTYSSDNGGSLAFNGSNNYIVTSNFTPNITNKTLSGWVKLSSISQQGGGLINLQSTDGLSFDAIVYNETNNGWGFGSNGFSRTGWSGVKETSTNDWVNITATYENLNYRIYRNGVLIYTLTSFNTLNFNFSSNSLLGYRHLGGGSAFLAGNIAQGLIYNRALSAAEVLQNYNATKGRFGL
jgi:hypothetical protein